MQAENAALKLDKAGREAEKTSAEEVFALRAKLKAAMVEAAAVREAAAIRVSLLRVEVKNLEKEQLDFFEQHGLKRQTPRQAAEAKAAEAVEAARQAAEAKAAKAVAEARQAAEAKAAEAVEEGCWVVSRGWPLAGSPWQSWHRLAPLGSAWHRVAPRGTAWHRVAPCGTAWHRVASLGTPLGMSGDVFGSVCARTNVKPPHRREGSAWHRVAPRGTAWHRVAPCGTAWHRVASLGTPLGMSDDVFRTPRARTNVKPPHRREGELLPSAHAEWRHQRGRRCEAAEGGGQVGPARHH